MSSVALKLTTLIVRTLSKPIANRIKAQAREHPRFRRICVSFAQSLHQLDMRLRLGLVVDRSALDRRSIREVLDAQAARRQQQDAHHSSDSSGSNKSTAATTTAPSLPPPSPSSSSSLDKAKDKEGRDGRVKDGSSKNSSTKDGSKDGSSSNKDGSKSGTSSSASTAAAAAKPPRIRPLSEAKAIDTGANFISEAFLFLVAGSLIVLEAWRSRRKENTRREDVADRLTALEETQRQARQALLALERELLALEAGVGVGVGTGSERRVPAIAATAAAAGSAAAAPAPEAADQTAAASAHHAHTRRRRRRRILSEDAWPVEEPDEAPPKEKVGWWAWLRRAVRSDDAGPERGEGDGDSSSSSSSPSHPPSSASSGAARN